MGSTSDRLYRFLPLLLLALIACSEGDAHIYLGKRFRPEHNCMESVAMLDVVSGAAAATNCPAVCLLAASPSGIGYDIYVSTMCPPLPPVYDASGTNPQCSAAIGAFTNGLSCSQDGGANDAAGP